MLRSSGGSRHPVSGRVVLVGLFLTVSLFGATGAGCDVPYASSTFRDAAMSQISTGVKSIVNGIIDGIFAVLKEAGDGSGSTSG